MIKLFCARQQKRLNQLETKKIESHFCNNPNSESKRGRERERGRKHKQANRNITRDKNGKKRPRAEPMKNEPLLYQNQGSLNE